MLKCICFIRGPGGRGRGGGGGNFERRERLSYRERRDDVKLGAAAHREARKDNNFPGCAGRESNAEERRRASARQTKKEERGVRARPSRRGKNCKIRDAADEKDVENERNKGVHAPRLIRVYYDSRRGRSRTFFHGEMRNEHK